jgi:hypothetical protein
MSAFDPGRTLLMEGDSMEAQLDREAVERKNRSESRLAGEMVPINSYLPVIETAGSARVRTKYEVGYRALALLVVAVKGEGLEQPIVDKVVDGYGLQGHFSPRERAFIEGASASDRDRIQFAWRYEAAWVLLWALGYVDDLKKPTAICDVPFAVQAMKGRTAEQFLAEASLRPIDDLLDEADLIYRYHWAVVDARLKGTPPPSGLDAGVTMERHYALNWLVGYMDQEWDDVSTDT